MNSNDPLRDQAKTIREHHEQQPAPRQETPREGRYRVQREQEQAEIKRNPHKGY